MMSEVLLIDDEKHVRTAYAQALELQSMVVNTLPSAAGVLERIGRNWPGILVTDIRMAQLDGLELMAKALEIDPELPVILITGHGDVPMAVQAMRDGAYDFLQKPFAAEVLADAVRRALEKRRLTIENRQLRARLSEGTPLEQTLVGRSAGIVRLREQIRNFAHTDADVLILGETGAGKERVARSLHDLSLRRSGRFVPINCGALPGNIIESELFGHEPGAFTGAIKQRIGKFEHAMDGTLFLDEIESMPMDLQVKMLRVLEDRKITRLGSNEEVDIDVRVVAATKEDLREATAKGRFREDLYYRLNVLALPIPPLRERRDDIPLLFHHFLSEAAARFNRKAPDVESSALAVLMAHDWPGNVRELQNAAIRYSLELGIETAPYEKNDASTDDSASGTCWLAQQVGTFEKQMIRQTLMQNGGSLKQTYEALGVSRKTLYDKMQKYGIVAEKEI
jgi:two-component system C4-dicarboxylate transport response regulator DctD